MLNVSLYHYRCIHFSEALSESERYTLVLQIPNFFLFFELIHDLLILMSSFKYVTIKLRYKNIFET